MTGSLAMTRSGIIPAYAGSTTVHAGERLGEGDHPRIRGEHASTHSSVCGSRGSSPHTRGARVDAVDVALTDRIIPAYAGSTDMTSPLWVP